MQYITPDLRLSDTESIQQAVNTAAQKDIRTVVIPASKTWHFDGPVALPAGITVILDGAQICADGIAFLNSHSCEAPCLGNEQDHIYLIGTGGASITGDSEPQIALANVKDYGIRGISFVGGQGIRLLHCRHGKVQQLRFTGSRHGIFLGEGCNNNLLGDLLAETKEEAVLWQAADTAVWGRSNNMYDSVLYRLDAKTDGAPAVAVHAGPVVVNNLFLRDITDRTAAAGVSVQLGGEDTTELLDLSLRNVASSRTAAAVTANCDGVYLGNLRGADISPEATRVLLQDCPEEVALPQLAEAAMGETVDANDPRFAAGNDAETLQNALDGAAGKCLVIPRYNARTGGNIWTIDKTLRIPADTTLVLLDAHLQLVDFTYCNLLTNAPGAKNIRIVGVGSATVDSGSFNGLKAKNADTLGFGPITDNALLLFTGVAGLTVEHLHLVQNRWYCILCLGCTNGHLADLDICAHPKFPDMGGIRIHSGCRELLVENITGLTGEDTVLIAAGAEDDRLLIPECTDISHIRVRTVKVNASRSNILSIKAHDGRQIHDIFAETLLDCSLPEQKKLPFATALVGDTDSENLHHISIRDLNGRSAATVQLGGSSEAITLCNIHSYGSSDNALRTFPLPESCDYQLTDHPQALAELDQGPRATVKNLTAGGIFFRCTQGSRYMRGTATSIITDKKKFLGTVVDLRNFRGEEIVIADVLAERIGNGIRITGEAAVEIQNFRAAEIGREKAVCGMGCSLTVNGEAIPVQATQRL